ncbi:MAG TPA: alginate lyase family protein, partial [Gemmatimonadaceae bacterium]|nr:alginate lyase family protein [Gemmatimonadaceae bacterium]
GKRGRDVVQAWSDTSGVVWTVRATERARYRIAFDYAAPAAAVLRLTVAGRQLDAALAPTGGETSFTTSSVGEVALEPGEYVMTVRPTTAGGADAVRLRAVGFRSLLGQDAADVVDSVVRRPTRKEVAAIERERVLAAARRYLREAPITVTAVRAVRSAGGPHDYYSEGDYWWPNPLSPDSPYVRRDGETNPDNFAAHRDAMRRLSLIVPALTAAYEITGDERYARQATAHLDAWFVAESTRMSPHLLYGQAIKGVATGRGTGIIDTIHLVEVARAVSVLERSGAIRAATLAGTKAWFRDYLGWMTTHAYGIDERNASNNHSAAWALQVAEFARLVGDSARRDSTRRFFRETLIPGQMAADGSFPRELGRTKPYGYSLFQLDVMAMVAESLSRPDDDLWTFATGDGRGMRRALEFMYPYIKDRKRWPKPPDVMYGDQWPIRHPALFFGARALGEPAYLELWRTLPADPTVEEVIRNYPVRQPLLWLSLPDPSRPDRS